MNHELDHRHFHTGVAHEGLHGANVCAGYAQVCGGRMPQRVTDGGGVKTPLAGAVFLIFMGIWCVFVNGR
jgi:hypothetical protein